MLESNTTESEDSKQTQPLIVEQQPVIYNAPILSEELLETEKLQQPVPTEEQLDQQPLVTIEQQPHVEEQQSEDLIEIQKQEVVIVDSLPTAEEKLVATEPELYSETDGTEIS